MNTLSNIFTHFIWRDALDIFLVTFLVFQLYRIVRGTRAIQMLLGVLALGVLLWVSSETHLFTLNWVLSHFFDSFIIIFAILFQEQIRSALINVASEGRRFILRGRKAVSKKDKELVDEIIYAAQSLSRTKTGALFVIERVESLGDYIQSGTVLGAKAHVELFLSLFHKDSPLHDGATVISKGKVASAGCFLPLFRSSYSEGVSKNLGTRHRAALGITQETDAIALIVSEETGQIRLAEKGKLRSFDGVVELRRQIFKSLGGGAS